MPPRVGRRRLIPSAGRRSVFGYDLSRLCRALILVAALVAPARAQVILGTVRDATGQPVPLAHVFAIDSLSELAPSVGTVTNADGRFLLRVAARAPYIGARRLGFKPERARALEWRDSDTLRVDIALQALPYMLATTHVGSGVCTRLDSLAPDNGVRQLWEGAVATVSAREAFLNSYRYTVVETHRNLSGSGNTHVFDTTKVIEPPIKPLEKDWLSDPLARYQPGSRLRGQPLRLSLRSPGDRVLLHPEFIRRFCFDDQVAAAADDQLEVSFREIGRSRKEPQVTGVMTFKRGVPGPARVAYEYSLEGKRLGRTEVLFELVDVNGTSFPLAAAHLMTIVNPETGKPFWEPYVKMRYESFTPVGPR